MRGLGSFFFVYEDFLFLVSDSKFITGQQPGETSFAGANKPAVSAALEADDSIVQQLVKLVYFQKLIVYRCPWVSVKIVVNEQL